jgi:hypothetical protein
MYPFPLEEYEFEDREAVRFMARLMDDEPQDNPPEALAAEEEETL